MATKSVSLSRKHFQLIADILAKNNASEHMVKAFASELRETNPRFDVDRFIGACKRDHQDNEPEEPVGILVNGDAVTCFSCETLGDDKVPIYRVNICPYSQTCGACGKVLVKGQTAAWPELFSVVRGVRI